MRVFITVNYKKGNFESVITDCKLQIQKNLYNSKE